MKTLLCVHLIFNELHEVYFKTGISLTPRSAQLTVAERQGFAGDSKDTTDVSLFVLDKFVVSFVFFLLSCFIFICHLKLK